MLDLTPDSLILSEAIELRARAAAITRDLTSEWVEEDIHEEYIIDIPMFPTESVTSTNTTPTVTLTTSTTSLNDYLVTTTPTTTGIWYTYDPDTIRELNRWSMFATTHITSLNALTAGTIPGGNGSSDFRVLRDRSGNHCRRCGEWLSVLNRSHEHPELCSHCGRELLNNTFIIDADLDVAATFLPEITDTLVFGWEWVYQ